MNALVIFSLLAVLMLTGMPISIALGLTVLTFMFTMTDVPVQAVALKLFTGIEKFEIMAIPFFILAGNFLTHGGVAKRMINFATSMVGHWYGGLGLAGVLACGIGIRYYIRDAYRAWPRIWAGQGTAEDEQTVVTAMNRGTYVLFNTNGTVLSATTDISTDLNIDSVTVMDFVMEVEDHFDIEIPLNVLSETRTVADLAKVVETRTRKV